MSETTKPGLETVPPKPVAVPLIDAHLVRRGICAKCGTRRLLPGPRGLMTSNWLCIGCHREYHVAVTTVLLLHELCPDGRVKEIYKL